MKRLTQNITSQWQEAANRLRPKDSAHKVIAYVESYDDVAFWRDVLDDFETENIKFEIMLPSRGTLERGKKAAMSHNLGPYMIACVDADYDWLSNGRTPVSQQLCSSPFVLHTYVYSIENFRCYAPGLHKTCTRATLNDRELVDIEGFVTKYSQIVWPLFVWNVWACRMGRADEFNISSMTDVISYHDINIHKLEVALEYMQRRVNKYINILHQRFPEGKKTYKPLMQELLGMGLTPETTYLYIQGHGLMSGVIMPLLVPICTQLRRERERDIESHAVHDLQLQNEMSSYKHSTMSIEFALKKSTTFRKSEQYQWLTADITRLITEVGRAK